MTYFWKIEYDTLLQFAYFLYLDIVLVAKGFIFYFQSLQRLCKIGFLYIILLYVHNFDLTLFRVAFNKLEENGKI